MGKLEPMTQKCSECGGDHPPEIHTLSGALVAWQKLAWRAAVHGGEAVLAERLAMGQVRLLWHREVSR